MKDKVINRLEEITDNRIGQIKTMKVSVYFEILDCLSEGKMYNPEHPITVTHPAPDLSEQMEIIGVLTGKQLKEQKLFPDNELGDNNVYVYGREYLPYDMSESQKYDDPILAGDLYIEELLFILEQGFKQDNCDVKITINKGDSKDDYIDIDVEC